MGRLRWRRGTAIGAAGMGIGGGALVTLAAVAFACTQIMVQMTITPTSGKPGTVVTTNVIGRLKPNATYEIQLAQTAGTFNPLLGGTSVGTDCMATTGVYKLAAVNTDATGGGWVNVKVTVPTQTSIGPHQMCGIETYPKPMQTGTSHVTFTVIGT